MKRILATLLVLVMVCSLAACGDKDSDSGNTSNSGAVPTIVIQEYDGPTKEAEKNDKGKTVINLWSITVETDSNREPYMNAIADLNKEYTDYEIVMEATENEAYKEKIKNAMAANDVADIFYSWSGGFLAEFVKQGKVYDLTDAFKPYIGKDIDQKMLGTVTFNDKIFAVPTTMNIVTLFANMDLLAKVGYTDVPKTYDELMDCCKKLKDAGIIPFGCAGGETWCVTEYLEPLAEKTIGSDALTNMFLGGASYEDEGLAKSVDMLQEWIKNGYFDPAGASTGNEDIKQGFMNGKYAFYQNGSWNCGDFAAKEGLNVKCAEFPVIDSTKSGMGQLIGGPSDVLAVFQGSGSAAKAAEIVVKLGKKICEYGYVKGCGLPAWNVTVDDSKINPLTKQVAEICKNATKYTLFGDTRMTAADKEVYLAYVAKVYNSEVDGKGFISGLKSELR